MTSSMSSDAKERNGNIQDEDKDDNKPESMRYCGAEQCKIMCSEKEFCANTGKQGLCESVKCVTFNV